MSPIPRREYALLLVGDIVLFVASLWLTLAIRYVAIPSRALFMAHFVPFTFLFAVWIVVFFLSGLYSKHTRLFRQRLPATILAAQVINIVFAALFFFAIPNFGIAPKTNLVLYLFVSAPLIFLWRAVLYGRIKSTKAEKGILLASGPDADLLAHEIEHDKHFRMEFVRVIDVTTTPVHEVVQHAVELAAKDEITFVVADFESKAVSVALPMLYDAAFRKKSFLLIDVRDLYEEVFDRVPLTLIQYEWVLGSLRSSRIYDTLKRGVDIIGALTLGLLSLLVYPFVILAIKIDDGGPIFITMPRVGKLQSTIHIVKFRSMTGNDAGNYGASGKSELVVTRVGKWLRRLRLDELPQLWNILRGDLSFVGPRPEVPALVANYNARIPYYNARHLITPGLSGWAQIKHDRHPHHGIAIEETKEKLSYDLYYLKRRSFLLDVYIILQTIRIMLTAKGN